MECKVGISMPLYHHTCLYRDLPQSQTLLMALAAADSRTPAFVWHQFLIKRYISLCDGIKGKLAAVEQCVAHSYIHNRGK